ncbi:helix-turn-helix transcriptional regulator [bacterium]|nr:helix-turn-helix transcriptional regulator [bacterium]
MPSRKAAARELAGLLGVLSHPDRIQIIEELRQEEKDVGCLRDLLGISASRVSQHLGLLKAHRLLEERRDGRHVYYRLTRSRLAHWLLAGLEFLQDELATSNERQQAIETARLMWAEGTKP